VKSEAVAHLRQAHEMSERLACRVIGCVRMAVRYRSRRIDDAGLRERLRALAKERRRFGYRRLHVLLRREGFVVNHKRLFRIYREERLMVRKRGGRKRALGTRGPIPVLARSPSSAAPSIRFLFHRPAASLRASSPQSVALMQLRFASLVVIFRCDLMTAGRSTSFPISWPVAGAFASWRFSTTAPASVWLPWRIPRCPASGSRVNVIFWSAHAASPRRSSATTARS
jgi:putative transposase